MRCTPLICALFLDTKRPPVNILEAFVAEMKTLLDDGLDYNGVHYVIKIHSFVCDTPGRCLIKQSKLYNGYEGCDKCTQEGLYGGRMTFTEIGYAHRTDESFKIYF